MTHRALLADDHLVVRSGLRALLDPVPDVEVVGEATDGADAISLAAELRPDVVLMDLRMPVLDGVTATMRVRELSLPVAVLVLTTYETDADILRALDAGAVGYLLKDVGKDELLRAIRSAAAGQSVLAPRVAARLVDRVRTPGRSALSAREIEVLELVARGRSNKQIARALHLSEATVKTHLLHVFSKLEVDDRTEAVTAALEGGILRLDG
jgi:DNA-binding NarL/FixJ family response regulator